MKTLDSIVGLGKRDVSTRVFYFALALTSVLAAIIRIPALSQDLKPYMFCDEEYFFYADVLRMLRNDSVSSGNFYSGPMNVYPIWIVARGVELFTPLSDEQLLLVARFILPLGLGALAVVPLALFLKYLSGSRFVGIIAATLYVLSSFLSGVSRYWYPDHYLFFFAALVVMFAAKISVVDKPQWTSVFLGVSAAMAFSVKYHSAILVLFVAAAFVARWKGFENSEYRTKQLSKSTLTFVASALTFILIFHLNTFFYVDLFFDQQSFNVENYGIGSSSITDGLLGYAFVLFVLTLGPLGLFLAATSTTILLKSRSFFVLISLLSPIVVLLWVFGSQAAFVSRNIIPVTPLFLAICSIGAAALIARLNFKPGPVSKLLVICLALLLGAQSSLAAYAFFKDLEPDSRELAELWIEENIPETLTIGTNESCFGSSAAEVAGRRVTSDPFMEEGLEYYVFDSYEVSSISGQFRGANASEALLLPKYLHFYYFRDKEIYKSPLGLITPEQLPRIDGYKLVQKFNKNGPEVWIWQKSPLISDSTQR